LIAIQDGRGIDKSQNGKGYDDSGVAYTMDTTGYQAIAGCLSANGKAAGSATQQDAENGMLVTHTLRGEGFDASEDGTGRGTPLVAVPLQEVGKRTGTSTDDPRAGIGIGTDGDPMYTLQAGAQHGIATAYRTSGNCGAWDTGDRTDALTTGTDPNSHILAFNLRGREGGAMPEMADVASLRAASGGSSRSYISASAVRRLTPEECELLQGFLKGYTFIPINKKGKMAADGPRYKSLGNSMAVPCMEWIGRRIAMVDAIPPNVGGEERRIAA